MTVETEDGLPVLRYRFDQRAWQRLQSTLLGKTLIFTDNADWSDVEIVRGYRAQHHVESAFRSMKNTHYISLRPRTDQKIAVFCCVLALLLCSLPELRRCGLTKSAFELPTRPNPGNRRPRQETLCDVNDRRPARP